MYPHGTIYKRGYPLYGVKKIAAPLRVKLLYHTLRGIGAGVIAYGVIFFLFTYAPLIQEELNYNFGQSANNPSVIENTLQDLAKANSTKEVQLEAEKFGVDSYFSVVIPKIGANANVIANVDASDEKSYLEALSEGVAHAKGTYFPGQGNRIFLFSHSTNSPINFAKYNAIFYLLSKLEDGDKIVVFFADKKYVYEVTDKKIVAPDDTSWLNSTGDGEELVLQTCDPPGTSWRRLIVVARPSSIDNVYGGI